MKQSISLISFTIVSIDPLGQGVAYIPEGIVFIPRTLPGEVGLARIWRSKQTVHFAQLVELQQISPLRIIPQCAHYQQCGGCHLQHTTYDHELQLKEKILAHLLRNLYRENIVSIPANNRFFYRNRTQLHYQLAAPKKIGMIGPPPESSIVEIPNCQVVAEEIKNTLSSWYQLTDTRKWEFLIPPKSPTSGHVEIYQHPQRGEIISWNAPYADSGFSQVNNSMNDHLCALVTELASRQQGCIIDLFGGNGNLTARSTNRSVLVVDHGPPPPNLSGHQDFYSLNLYNKNAWEQLNTYQKKWRKKSSPLVLILDPPRSGLKNLLQFTNSMRPSAIIYVSCHPITMARDLASIQTHYYLKKVYLLDLFPASYHFETVVYLETKQ